jgi:hypothetical protein
VVRESHLAKYTFELVEVSHFFRCLHLIEDDLVPPTNERGLITKSLLVQHAKVTVEMAVPALKPLFMGEGEGWLEYLQVHGRKHVQPLSSLVLF